MCNWWQWVKEMGVRVRGRGCRVACGGCHGEKKIREKTKEKKKKNEKDGRKKKIERNK